MQILPTFSKKNTQKLGHTSLLFAVEKVNKSRKKQARKNLIRLTAHCKATVKSSHKLCFCFMDSQTEIQTRFTRIKINKTIFSWTVFALQDKHLVILTVCQGELNLEPKVYQNSYFSFLPLGKI